MPVSEQAWGPIWHMSPSRTHAHCICAKSPESHSEVPAPHAVCRSTSTGSLSLPVPYKATYLSMQDAGQGTNMNSVTASLREMWTAAAFSACSVDQQPETGQRIPRTVPVTGRRPGKGRFETQTQPKQGFFPSATPKISNSCLWYAQKSQGSKFTPQSMLSDPLSRPLAKPGGWSMLWCTSGMGWWIL